MLKQSVKANNVQITDNSTVQYIWEGGRVMIRREHKGVSGVLRMFYFLMWVVLKWVISFVITHQAVHLPCFHFFGYIFQKIDLF